MSEMPFSRSEAQNNSTNILPEFVAGFFHILLDGSVCTFTPNFKMTICFTGKPFDAAHIVV